MAKTRTSKKKGGTGNVKEKNALRIAKINTRSGVSKAKATVKKEVKKSSVRKTGGKSQSNVIKGMKQKSAAIESKKSSAAAKKKRNAAQSNKKDEITVNKIEEKNATLTNKKSRTMAGKTKIETNIAKITKKKSKNLAVYKTGDAGSSNKKNVSTVYQFKIILVDTEPLIWRRIQVPKNTTFYNFHISIVESMGWSGVYRHSFTIYDPRKKSTVYISRPSAFDLKRDDSINEEQERISKYFPKKTEVAEYEYDFGDCWLHEIQFEGEVPRKQGEYYPLFIDGERACPPEECGGVSGYENLCKVMQNPKDPEYEDLKEWLKSHGIKKLNPDKFDPKSVRLSRPGGYVWVQM